VILTTFALVYLTVSPQVGDNGEVTTATLNFACKWLLASMAVHVCLERTGARESLVTDLALVLLLRARRDLGAELAHHGLGRGRHGGSEERIGAGKCPRAREINRLAGRAVVGD